MGASVTIPMTGGKKTIIIGNRGFNFMAYRPRLRRDGQHTVVPQTASGALNLTGKKKQT